MYRLNITLNIEADHKLFNEFMQDNYPLFTGFTTGKQNTLYLYFTQEPVEEDKNSIMSYYSSLTSNDVSLTTLQVIYDKQAYEGSNFYNKFSLDISERYRNGDISIEDAYFIEKKILNIKNFLKSGDWASAKYELQFIEIEQAYTQELHDTLKTEIDTYVNENY